MFNFEIDIILQAARRELERQRLLEWEKQRRDQLMSDKSREQNSVSKLQLEVGNLRQELDLLVGVLCFVVTLFHGSASSAVIFIWLVRCFFISTRVKMLCYYMMLIAFLQGNRRAELSDKIELARQNIMSYTSAIENMKTRRDKTLSDIDRFQLEINVCHSIVIKISV